MHRFAAGLAANCSWFLLLFLSRPAGREYPTRDEAGLGRGSRLPLSCELVIARAKPVIARAKRDLALDVGRPGLFDQLDDRVRHRDVVEFFSHLAALFERPLEELDG